MQFSETAVVVSGEIQKLGIGRLGEGEGSSSLRTLKSPEIPSVFNGIWTSYCGSRYFFQNKVLCNVSFCRQWCWYLLFTCFRYLLLYFCCCIVITNYRVSKVAIRFTQNEQVTN